MEESERERLKKRGKCLIMLTPVTVIERKTPAEKSRSRSETLVWFTSLLDRKSRGRERTPAC